MSKEFKDACGVARQQIEKIKGSTAMMMDMVVECGPAALTEARKNIEIAYRHLEDARMRLGKAIQAADGGVSVYDKPDRQFHQPVVADEKGGQSDADLDNGFDNS